jgi:hypothetical protein
MKRFLLLAALLGTSSAHCAEVPVAHTPIFTVPPDPPFQPHPIIQVTYEVFAFRTYRLQYSEDGLAWWTAIQSTIEPGLADPSTWSAAMPVDPACVLRFVRLVEVVP